MSSKGLRGSNVKMHSILHGANAETFHSSVCWIKQEESGSLLVTRSSVNWIPRTKFLGLLVGSSAIGTGRGG